MALSRHAYGTKIIETIPGRGYRFAAFIDSVPAQTANRRVISAAESITRITLEEEEEVDTAQSDLVSASLPTLPIRRSGRRPSSRSQERS